MLHYQLQQSDLFNDVIFNLCLHKMINQCSRHWQVWRGIDVSTLIEVLDGS